MNIPAVQEQEPVGILHSILQRIATGPELSKDITQEEARLGMRYILEGKIDPVQAAIFLIALRMKRETDEENLGIYDGIRDVTQFARAPVDEVMDVADPYDGYNRCLPSSPFLPALLAECGVAAVTHGVERVGPKYGVTHRQVLRAAGAPVDLTVEAAAARLGDARIGWAYVDQKAFCPRLHGLIDFRGLIVKRPAITTVETMVGPVRGQRKTHIMTGYVHKPYARIYALLARHAGFDSALIVRGVEGGVIPSLRQAGKVFYYHDQGEEQSLELNPLDLGIDQPLRAPPLPASMLRQDDAGNDSVPEFDAAVAAQAAAAAGLDALAGKPGPARDGLIYAAALCLWHLKRYPSINAAAAVVRHVLDSGKTRTRIQA